MAKPPFQQIHIAGEKDNGDKFESQGALPWLVRTALLDRLVQRAGIPKEKVDAVILDVNWRMGKSIAAVLYRGVIGNDAGEGREETLKYEEVTKFTP